MKSGERDGSLGCDMLGGMGVSVLFLREKPWNCAIRSSYWLSSARNWSL